MIEWKQGGGEASPSVLCSLISRSKNLTSYRHPAPSIPLNNSPLLIPRSTGVLRGRLPTAVHEAQGRSVQRSGDRRATGPGAQDGRVPRSEPFRGREAPLVRVLHRGHGRARTPVGTGPGAHEGHAARRGVCFFFSVAQQYRLKRSSWQQRLIQCFRPSKRRNDAILLCSFTIRSRLQNRCETSSG